MKVEKYLMKEFIQRMPAGAAGAGELAGGGVGTLTGDTNVHSVPPTIGAHGTVTVEAMEGAADSVLEQDIDRLLVKVRPYDNVVDTIVREIGATQDISSMEPQSGSEGTLPIIDTFNSSSNVTVETSDTPGTTTKEFEVINPNAWIAHDTFVVHVDGYPTFYVYEVDYAGKKLKCILLTKAAAQIQIAKGAKLQRLGTAVSERDAMISANEMMPDITTNYCQIFMKTISMGLLAEIHKKKVDYGFSSLKEHDLWDFRRQIESAFLFGVMSKFNDIGNRRKITYTCNGLWNQINKDFAMPESVDDKTYISLTESAFVGNNGSDTKILLCGHGLLSSMMGSVAYQRVMEQSNVELIAGIRFRSIETNHGRLLIKPHHLFIGEHYYDGLVLDPNYILKKYFLKTQTINHDLEKAGIERSKTETLTEISTIFATNLPTHLRIIGKALAGTDQNKGTGAVEGINS